jgi:Gluconate 2-dehydrogenase subunit 3
MELRHFGFTQSVQETEGGDRRDAFRAARAELGGYPTPIAFSERERQVLNAICDEIIPPGRGFPAPSAVGVVEDFFSRYIAPKGATVTRFPNVIEDTFKSGLATLGQEFLTKDHAGRVAALKRLEIEQSEFFGQLRALTYGGYYSRPEVIAALRHNHDAGRDYRGAPQPYGYEGSTMDWGDMIPPRKQAGYTATEDVKRLVPRGR